MMSLQMAPLIERVTLIQIARSDDSAETGRDRRLLWRALRRAARTEHRIATA
jgi:hypothetical protein